MALRYKGKDERTDWLPGVPARNLSDDEIKELGFTKRRVTDLIESGLYAEVAPRREREDKPEEPAVAAQPSEPAEEERE